MTNEKIIMDHAFQLMEQGKIHGSGQYGTIIGENGEEMHVELPEEIHAFAYWKAHGRSVKKTTRADFMMLIVGNLPNTSTRTMRSERAAPLC